MAWFWKIIRLFLLLGIGLGCVGALALLGLGWWGSSKVVKIERADLEESHREVYAAPHQFGFKLDSFDVDTADGLTLKGCVLTPNANGDLGSRGRRVRKEIQTRGKVDLPRRDELRGTIIMAHSLGGRKEQCFTIAERFAAVGFRCVIYDSRAHGDSEGEDCTYGFYERDDLRRVVEEARHRVGNLGPVGLFGVSLGAGVGLQALDGSNAFDCGVFVSPFASLSHSVWRDAKRDYGIWRFAVVPATDVAVGMRYGFRMIEAAPVAAASRISEPVMLVHGSSDEVTPIEDSETLILALMSETKKLKRVDGGDHQAILTQGGDELYAEMCEFFLRHMWG